jgi:hypothetical protein
MSKKLIAQLQSLKHGECAPSAEWVAKNRALLLSQIKNTVSPQVEARAAWENVWMRLSIFMPRPLVYNVVRPLAVLVVVALVGTSGWIASVDAAYDAIPGDGVAYYLKRGLEQTQVAVVNIIGDENAQAKVHLKLASARASEVKKILAQPSFTPAERQNHVAATVADLTHEIATVSTKIDESTDAALAKTVAVDTKQIKTVLQDAKNLLSASTTPELAQQVSEAKDYVKDTSVKAVEVLVTKVAAGDQSVSADEVKQVVDKTLQSVVSEVDTSKQTVDGVKAVVTTVSNELKVATSSANVLPNSTTTSVKDISDLAAKTNQVAEQTQQVSDDVSKQVSAAQAAIQSGDLAAAVGTIKDVAQVAKTVEQLSDSVRQEAQAVLPTVQIKVIDSSLGTVPLPSTTSTSTPAVAPVATSSAANSTSSKK